LMCAADTFRAAAIEQLEIWGQRTGTEVIKTKAGGDPSAVLFDALQAANGPQDRLRHRRHGGTAAYQAESNG
jgi:signal recognition particle GTPase